MLYTSTEKKEKKNFDTEWARMFAKISAIKKMGKKLNFSLNQHSMCDHLPRQWLYTTILLIIVLTIFFHKSHVSF